MDFSTRVKAMHKLAFFGPAKVSGSPGFMHPPMTVGQLMYDINAQAERAGNERRKYLNDIVNTGVDVNAPVRSLIGAGFGALAANGISKMLGMNPFYRGITTAIGANYGYKNGI